MTGLEIFVAVLGSIIALTLVVFLGMFFGRGEGEESWQLPKWLSENKRWLIPGWAFIVLIWGRHELLGGWWIDLLFSWLGLLLVGGLTLYGMMTKGTPGKWFRHTLATASIWILIGISAWYVFSNTELGKITNKRVGAYYASFLAELSASPGATPPTSIPAKPEVIKFEAPTDKLSDEIETKGAAFRWDADGEMDVIVDGSWLVKDTPTSTTRVGCPKVLQFRSSGSSVVHVTFTRLARACQ